MARSHGADLRTLRRDLRTGRSVWTDDRPGRGTPVRRLSVPVEVDVAIVGAGISGAFMAHALAASHRVAVFDRRGPVLGSTLASTAMLQWELDRPLIALEGQIGAPNAARVYRRSREAVRDLQAIVRRAGLRCGLQSKASLYLAGDAFGSRALARETERRADLGLESTYVSAADLRARFGLQRTAAILSQGAASADPARLAAGLLRAAGAAGAQIFAPVEITGLLEGRDHVSLINDQGLEIVARHVVFCCGYEFPKGVPTDGARIVSTWALATAPLRAPPAWLSRHLLWEASEPYLYLRTTRDGRLIAGGEDEASATRHADPSAITPKTRALTRKLERLIPDLNLKAETAWAGVFGESATSMPLIGQIPNLPRAYAVMGFGGNGITYSVIASQIVAAAIRGRPDPDADLYAFP